MSTVLPDDEAVVDPMPDELLEQPAAVRAATAAIASAGASFRTFKSVPPCSLAYVRSVNHALHADIAGHFLCRRAGRLEKQRNAKLM
jgi:hypothetical protein